MLAPEPVSSHSSKDERRTTPQMYRSLLPALTISVNKRCTLTEQTFQTLRTVHCNAIGTERILHSESVNSGYSLVGMVRIWAFADRG